MSDSIEIITSTTCQYQNTGILLYTVISVEVSMGNPNPNPANLKALPRCDRTTEPLADSPMMVRLFRDVDAVIRQHPNRSAWLRRVITEAAQRELMSHNQTNAAK